MTNRRKNLNIVVIGDEDLVNGLRLAGVTSYFTIANEETGREEVRKFLTETIEQSGAGIIAIQEEYALHAEDIIARVKESRPLMPIIIEVPSKHGTKYENVTEFYRSYVREFTGFDVAI